MFTPSDVEKVVYVVDQSRAAEQLEVARGKKKLGRPSGLNSRLFLIGALLSALDGDGIVLTNLYDVLTKRMDRQWQVRLGIREYVSGDPTFSQDSLDRLSAQLGKACEFGEDSMADLNEGERLARRTRMLDLVDSMLDATLIGTLSTYRSIDATGVWGWGKSPRRRGIRGLESEASELERLGRSEDVAVLREVIERMKADRVKKALQKARSSKPEPAAVTTTADEAGDEDDSARTMAAAEFGLGAKPAHDPDARSSGKTSKDGRTEWYYGYTLNALVRVAGPKDVYCDEPRLIERIVVTPAGRDLIWASRELLARAQPSDQERIVLWDRWYSNLTEDNWYHYLRSNGWNQAVDMREDDQSWTDVRGMRITAGSPHCPATPDALERIPKPFGAKEGAKGDFHEAIAQRVPYAMSLHGENAERGTRRFMCPALAGKVRCPLRPQSLALSAAHPLVENPPIRDTAPECCTVKSTVTISADDRNAKARLWQRHYWGTPEQTAETDRRTSVEQAFSRLKDSNGTDMTRGFVRVVGLARVSLAVGLMAVATNIRELEVWAVRHDDGRAPGHPLLKPRDDFVVFHMSPEEAGGYAAWKSSLKPSKRDAAA